MFSQSPLCNILNFCCCQSFHLLKSLDFSDCYATSLITTDRKSIFGGKKIIWKFSRIFFSIMSFHVYKSRCFLVVHLFALCFYGDYFLIVSIFFTVNHSFLSESPLFAKCVHTSSELYLLIQRQNTDRNLHKFHIHYIQNG